MQKRRLLFAVLLGSLVTGCSCEWAGAGSGGASADDAARCVSLVAGLGMNLHVQPTDHFLMVSNADSASAASTGQFLEQVSNRFYSSLAQAGFAPKPSSDKLVCVLLDSYKNMDAYGRKADGVDASWMDGYYSYQTNRTAVVRQGGLEASRASTGSPKPAGVAALARSPGDLPAVSGLNLTTVTHELAHQLAFNSGLQRRDVTYPFWLTEGLATNFEADNPGSCGVPSQDSRYRSRLASAKAGRNLITLGQFVGMTELSSSSTQSTINSYAQAWGLFHFLLQHHRKELRQYMADLAQAFPAHQDSQSLQRRFISAFGPIEPLEREFLRFADGSMQ